MTPSVRSRRRGSAILTAVFAIVLLSGLCAAILGVTMSSQRERSASVDRTQAYYSASSGISHVLANFASGDQADVGSDAARVSFSDGEYWVDVEEGADSTWTVTSRGYVRGEAQGVEAVIAQVGGGVYANAIFAGNSSGDPTYVLELGGADAQADEIVGDVYSGGSVAVAGDASVAGEIQAAGAITGATGKTGASQPIPDIAAMDYPHTADFDVAAMFAEATYKSDDAGGSAWQVPAANPAHIFRKNPSDRSDEIAGTKKDDWFLEDPYEKVGVDKAMDGSDPYQITLSDSGTPYTVGGKTYSGGGNKKVYYIDGNLWLHSYPSFSFEIKSAAGSGTQVTFVVRGNVYFSDNLFYEDPAKDGVAFIAMKDPDVEDSGNIYFGDPEFGTLEEMYAFMYAENNFHDVNLDAKGSASVELHGNMTAGNQVLIQRDFDDQHSKLMVDFDDRIEKGTLDVPGLPKTKSGGAKQYEVRSWRRVPVN